MRSGLKVEMLKYSIIIFVIKFLQFGLTLECDDSRPCIRFCCVKNECSDWNESFEYFNIEGLSGASEIKTNFQLLDSTPPCKKAYNLVGENVNDKWHFLQNGSIVIGKRHDFE